MLRKLTVSSVLSVILIVSPVLMQRGESVHTHNCNNLSWCISTCESDRTGGRRACYLANVPRRAACLAMKVSPIAAVRRLYKLCERLRKRDYNCCKQKVQRDYEDCMGGCCARHYPDPSERCPSTARKCRNY